MKSLIVLFLFSILWFMTSLILSFFFQEQFIKFMVIGTFILIIYYGAYILGYSEGYHKKLKEPHLVYVKELKPRDEKGRFMKRNI